MLPGFARAGQLLVRMFSGAPAVADAPVSSPASATGGPIGRIGRFGLARWIDERLNAARRRNEQAAIEETRSYLRAKRRSLALMLSLLTPEQRAEFQRYRHFHVTGGETGTRYRIRVASFANVDIIGPAGSTLYRLCAHPRGDVPVYDVMAAQMLHLQDVATERAFLRFANVHPVVSTRRPERGFERP